MIPPPAPAHVQALFRSISVQMEKMDEAIKACSEPLTDGAHPGHCLESTACQLWAR